MVTVSESLRLAAGTVFKDDPHIAVSLQLLLRHVADQVRRCDRGGASVREVILFPLLPQPARAAIDSALQQVFLLPFCDGGCKRQQCSPPLSLAGCFASVP